MLVTVMSSKVNKLILFGLACLGMLIMHTVSVTIGAAITLIIPQSVIQIIVVVLFLGFGLFFFLKAVLNKGFDEDDEKAEIEEKFEKVRQLSRS